jgi:hypothetical protein
VSEVVDSELGFEAVVGQGELGGERAGVVDQDIEAVVTLAKGGRQGSNAREAGKIHGQVVRSAMGANLRKGGLGLVRIPAGE